MARIPRRLGGTAPAGQLVGDDAFLLSLVDGTLDEGDLCFVTGRSAPEIEAAIARLEAAGLVSLAPGEEPPPRTATVVADDDEPGLDIDAERRREVRELFARLDGSDHYSILGLPRTATKSQVRAAYYRLAPAYHPDRHFRKKLGSYKKRIETIFARLTQAYDALRKEAANDPVPVAPAPASAPVSPSRPVSESRLGSYQPTPPRVRSSTPGHDRPSQPGSSGGSPRPALPQRSPAELAAADRARREALARKLGMGGFAGRRPVTGATTTHTRVRTGEIASEPPPAVYEPVAGVAASAAELLRQKYEEIAAKAKLLRAQKLAQRARAASEAGDVAMAVRLFAEASALCPDDGELRLAAWDAEERMRGSPRAKA